MNEVLIYQKEDGQSTVEVSLVQDTLWLSMAQIADLFGVNPPRFQNILKTYSEVGNSNPRQLFPKWNPFGNFK